MTPQESETTKEELSRGDYVAAFAAGAAATAGAAAGAVAAAAGAVAAAAAAGAVAAAAAAGVGATAAAAFGATVLSERPRRIYNQILAGGLIVGCTVGSYIGGNLSREQIKIKEVVPFQHNGGDYIGLNIRGGPQYWQQIGEGADARYVPLELVKKGELEALGANKTRESEGIEAKFNEIVNIGQRIGREDK